MKRKALLAALLLAGCASPKDVQPMAENRTILALEPADITEITVHADERFDLQTKDKTLIKTFVQALDKMQVGTKYTGDELAADSMEYVIFTTKTGEQYRITFDMGKLDMDGSLYEVENRGPFSAAMQDAEQMAMEGRR